MQLYTSPAIVFRMVRYGETSIICDAYTREHGLRSFIASGIRTAKKSGIAALYRPLSIVELTAPEAEDKLSRVKEIRLLHPYQFVADHIVHSSIAMFLIEVARNSIREKETNTELFDFLYYWLLFLDSNPSPHPLLPLLFLTELADMLGFGPLNNHSAQTPFFDLNEGTFVAKDLGLDSQMDEESSSAFATILQTNRENIGHIHMHRSIRNQLTDQIVRYFLLHIPGFRPLQSLPVLREVLS